MKGDSYMGEPYVGSPMYRDHQIGGLVYRVLEYMGTRIWGDSCVWGSLYAVWPIRQSHHDAVLVSNRSGYIYICICTKRLIAGLRAEKRLN